VPPRSTPPQPHHHSDDGSARGRILDAAFAAFAEGGYADTSTLEIATRARVSKRELYALVGNKQELLLACIAERARRLPTPADLPKAHNRETLGQVLAGFGTRLLVEVSDPTVVAAFRLAIAEAERTPEVAQTLNTLGRQKSRAALTEIMAQARSAGLISGAPADLAAQFMALLWGDLLVSLLLRVADPPTPPEAERRAREAAAAFLQLHSPPDAARAY
jgi:AcrR family transcriptional regulator